MFGKPEWFCEKRVAWRLKPACWQGWAYSIVWLGIIVIPILCLLATSRVPEALIWLMITAGYLAWDLRKVVKPKAAVEAQEDVLYITDDENDSQVVTQNYELQLRR